MKIPVGNFGQQIAQPGPRPDVPRGAFVDGTAQGMAAAGEKLSGIGSDLLDNLSKARTLRTMAESKTALSEAHSQLVQELDAGQIDPADADALWESRSEKLITERLKDVGPMSRDVVAAQLQGIGAEFGGRVRQAATRRAQQVIGGDLVALGNELERGSDPEIASARYEQTVRALGPSAGWTPAQIETDTNRFKERVWATKAYSLVNGARNNMQALNDVEQRLQSDEFSALDPQRRAVLMTTAAGYKAELVQRQLAAAQRAELVAARRDREAAPIAWQAQQWAERGIAPAAEWVATNAPKLVGTAYQGVFEGAVKAAGETGAFGMKPLADMQAQITQEQADLAKAATPEKERMLNLHTQILNAAVRGYQSDPLAEAVARRVIPPLPPLDLSAGIEGLADGIRARFGPAHEVEAVTGRPVSVFTASESAQVAAIIKALPASQKASFLGTLYTAFGDDHAYRAVMGQMKGLDPFLAQVGMRAASKAQATLQSNMFSPDVVQSAGDVAATMVHGDDLLRQGGKEGTPKYPVPKDEEFESAIRNKVGALYRGSGAGDSGGNQFLQDVHAVKAYYVGRAAQDGDISGVIDSNRLEQAIVATLGTPVNFHGNGQVLAPWGMDGITFATRANKAVHQVIQQAGLQDKVMPYMRNVGLIGAGGGVYFPTLAGTPITDAKGQPISIRLTSDADSGLDQYGRPISDQTSKDAPSEGLLVPGNIDLNTRPVINNKDGSISTVRSMSFEEDGQEVLIPTVAADGSGILTDDEAIAQYRRTGQFLGKFDTPDNATAYAKWLHESQARQYGGQR